MFEALRQKQQTIRFLCEPADREVIAAPVPAKSVLPDWFRKLPPISAEDRTVTNNGLTVKRCMPFLDAMTSGWIIPLAATVRLQVSENGAKVDAGWEFDRVMVSNHGAHQVRGNPREPSPPCKFHNYWSIRTPPGWSCLFVPPLNRAGQPFECVSGLVDTDRYFAPIHFPFFANAPDGLYVLERGTPLVQVIPIQRDGFALGVQIGSESAQEEAERQVAHRNTIAGEGWYRKFARALR